MTANGRGNLWLCFACHVRQQSRRTPASVFSWEGPVRDFPWRGPSRQTFCPRPMSATLQNFRQRCAEQLLALYRKANAGHIGSSLSCLEILVDLCFQRMAADDVLILSKGHA